MADEDLSETVTIQASPEVVYALVSDVTRTGEWSPENVGGRWVGGATGPAVGARFRGSNQRGWRRWSTSCRVVAAEPGRRFAFEVSAVGVPVSRWTYDLRGEGDATVVTERWRDRRPRVLAFLGGIALGVSDMRAHTRANIATTLANLARVAEQPR